MQDEAWKEEVEVVVNESWWMLLKPKVLPQSRAGFRKVSASPTPGLSANAKHTRRSTFTSLRGCSCVRGVCPSYHGVLSTQPPSPPLNGYSYPWS